MRKYKVIEFAEGNTMSFASFKETYGHLWVFNNLSKKQKDVELKKAYKVATNGNNTRATKKVKKSESENTREETI